MNMIISIFLQIVSLFQVVNTGIPVTDCNVFISNSDMQSGYRREYTVYSDDCTLDWYTTRLQTFEDASFVLSFVQPVNHIVYFPIVQNMTVKSGNQGFGFGCEIEYDDVDHILIVCESTSEKFDFSPEQTIQLTPLNENKFSGCLEFGTCNQ